MEKVKSSLGRNLKPRHSEVRNLNVEMTLNETRGVNYHDEQVSCYVELDVKSHKDAALSQSPW